MLGKFLRALIWIAVVVGILIGAARSTAVRWWRMPPNDLDLGTSTAPTVREGDLLILWRLTAPDIGDLVVCPDPDDPRQVVVGRIAATEGQTVRVKGDDIYIDNRKVRTETACPEPKFESEHPATGETVTQRCAIERLGSIAHPRGEGGTEGTNETKVPQDTVFLVSDNRRFPFDSREFGVLERSTCSESIVFRLVSKHGYFDVPRRLMVIR